MEEAKGKVAASSLLHEIAESLSGPIYGNVVSYEKAIELINK
jgi:hypothetical protein